MSEIDLDIRNTTIGLLEKTFSKKDSLRIENSIHGITLRLLGKNVSIDLDIQKEDDKGDEDEDDDNNTENESDDEDDENSTFDQEVDNVLYAIVYKQLYIKFVTNYLTNKEIEDPVDILYMERNELSDKWSHIQNTRKEDSKKIKKKGAYQCPKCKSWFTEYVEIQKASSDEPMSISVTCTDCLHNF